MRKSMCFFSFILIVMTSSHVSRAGSWRALGSDSAEIMSVMLGVAGEMASIEKSGELFIDRVEKRIIDENSEIYRIGGIVVPKDGLVEYNFALAITRVKQSADSGQIYQYGLLYKEKRI